MDDVIYNRFPEVKSNLKTNKKVIAVDFDGVIHDYSKGWQGGEIYGDIIKDAKYALKRLMDDRFSVVIFTARVLNDEVQEIKVFDWLNKNGFNLGVHYDKLTSDKIPALVYIDDRGIRFTNWQDIIKYFH